MLKAMKRSGMLWWCSCVGACLLGCSASPFHSLLLPSLDLNAGESVANLADVVGTAFGIALAKANLPVLPTFVALSIGYLAASR